MTSEDTHPLSDEGRGYLKGGLDMLAQQVKFISRRRLPTELEVMLERVSFPPTPRERFYRRPGFWFGVGAFLLIASIPINEYARRLEMEKTAQLAANITSSYVMCQYSPDKKQILDLSVGRLTCEEFEQKYVR